MQQQTKRRTLATLLAGAALFSSAAQAAGYPERPINLIVSYGPGGGTDLVARMMAPFLQKYLGGDARIVVLNRPGARSAGRLHHRLHQHAESADDPHRAQDGLHVAKLRSARQPDR